MHGQTLNELWLRSRRGKTGTELQLVEYQVIETQQPELSNTLTEHEWICSALNRQALARGE